MKRFIFSTLLLLLCVAYGYAQQKVYIHLNDSTIALYVWQIDSITFTEDEPLTPPSKAEQVDLGLSVLWADCNVGGDSESPIGGLYGWADPTGEKTSQNIADYVVLRKYLTGQIPNNITGTEYDIATAKWGHGWRMPSKDEWKELVEKCKWAKEKAFNVYGYRVEGPNGNSIFLPNTGLRFAESISNTDAGYYWTSEMALNDRECAYYYYFNEDKINDIVTTRNYVYSGRAIRPVHDK